MSVNVYLYKNDVPKDIKIVRNNDSFFQKVQLVNDETTRKLLNLIDKAEFGNETMIISRSKKMGMIYKEYLSTGCKTLLNAYYFPEICFDMVECGRNVKYLIPLLKSGYLLLENPMLYVLDDTNVDCDIVYNKKHYTQFDSFIEAIMKDRRTCRLPDDYVEKLAEEEIIGKSIDTLNSANTNMVSKV